jgi:hypothetical protein
MRYKRIFKTSSFERSGNEDEVGSGGFAKLLFYLLKIEQ